MVVLTAGVTGLVQAREARAFSPRVYVIATLAFDAQVLGGLVLYALGGYWGHDSLLVSVVHPVLALLGVSAAHVGLRRSRLQETDVAGHRTAVGGLLLGLLAILLAISVASVGIRG